MEGTATADVTVIPIPEAATSTRKAELVIRAREGDRSAFAELYESHAQKVYRTCLQILHEPEDAQDAASEAFVNAMEHLGSLREPSAFSGWLSVIARHVALSRIAERRRTCEIPDGLEAQVPDHTAPDPVVAAERRETSDLLAEAAATLNERYRHIYELHVRRAWDAGRIAEALGVTTAHAYVLVSRVKEALREGLRAVVMVRGAKGSCRSLQAIAARLGDERSPRMRQMILHHVRRCETCSARVHPALMSSR
jgi:RNA polymerase sigma factor (sigma-70 family)